MNTSDNSGSGTEALRALARALAPLIAEELRLEPTPHATPAPTYDKATCCQFVSQAHLGDFVLLRAETFFARLHEAGRAGSAEVVQLLNLKGPTSIPANLTNPLKKRAARLGVGLPWTEEADAVGRTVWVDQNGNAGRLLTAIEEEIERRDLERDRASRFMWREGELETLSRNQASEVLGFDPESRSRKDERP